MGAFGPGGELGRHAAYLFRELFRQVVQLGPVRIHIVEFPFLFVKGHQLPFSVAHGSVAFVLKEDGFFPGERLPCEGGLQANALHRFDLVAV